MNHVFWALLVLTTLAACKKDHQSLDPLYNIEPKEDTGRWYTQAMVSNGKIAFENHCAICHGKNAEATPNWKVTDLNGNYPPPPLNGTAHAWHHDIPTLMSVIKQGGKPLGGVMPAFEKQFTDQEVLELIASFQSYWTNEIYEHWLSLETGE